MYDTSVQQDAHADTRTRRLRSASPAVTFSLPDSHGQKPILWDTDALLFFTSSACPPPFLEPLLPLVGMGGGGARRRGGGHVRQMEDDDTPTRLVPAGVM